MRKDRDSSNRISRLSTEEAQNYLKIIKGDRYVKYRKDWDYYGRTQKKPEYPLQVNIEITSACNLRCKMCYRNYNMNSRSGYLSIEDIRTIVDQFSEADIPSLWISGGEPLLHPDICNLLNILGEANPLDFWMVTNGLLMTEEIADAIIKSGLTWLSVSIDAATSDTYRKIRGGDIDNVRRNIELFLEARKKKQSALPFLRVSFVKMKENRGEEQAFIDEWSDKADIIDFQTLADYHNLDAFNCEDVLNSDYVCTAPFTLLSVLPNGDLIPCCNGFFSEKSAYNIYNTTLLEYWRSDFHEAFSESVKNKDYCDECIKCVKSFLPRKEV